MWCAVCRLKQQSRFSGCVLPQVLCDIHVQVDFSLRGIRLEIFHDLRMVLFNLLLNLDSAAIIDDVADFERKSL